ncbi:hypothetical protein A8C75_14445 [Marinobacterium aestuarii]|uniref:Uncharacterized protein n=1 Tax=Marinobacterium aestuarii TaxID=1821621 RepID=A0A1A9EZQ7_9GAMM|nr:hypothetical protein [Marinobacterium aestuarii]ANG63554.1 hypothetical protein A8C75_14445 [Marinobacterium aestuarii]
MESPRKIELHYYFSDMSHSMNALVRNKCEAEFIAVAIEVAEILGINLELDCEALQEGGIREVWKALGDNSVQIALLISALALILSVIPHTDQELIDLQKEDLRLSIEQRKQALGKIKEDIENKKITSETIETAVRVASRSYKVVTRKSNFYKILSNYEKVTQVGYSELSSDGRRLSDERVVNRVDFQKFILTSQDLKPRKDSSAYIEIVAPVLTDGKAKWKGIYDDQSINFSMNDHEFKRAVVSKLLSFKNGDGIICVLLVHKKVDELGEIVTSGYSVEVVLENIHSGVSGKTAQGKKYSQAKKMSDGQGDMFGPNNT